MKTILTISLSLISLSVLAQLALVKPAGSDNWGYISTKGEMVIPADERTRGAFSSDGFASVYDKKAKTHYFIDKAGNKLETEEKQFKLKNVFGFGTKGFVDGIALVQVGKRWGYMNTAGKMIIPAKYEKATIFNNGFAIAKKGSWVIVDTNGNETPIDGVEDARPFSEGLARVRKAGLWGFVNNTGKMVIDAQFRSLGKSSSGLAYAKTKDGKVGYINTNGEWAVEAKYNAAKDFSDGLGRVKKGEEWLFVDPKGNELAMPDAEKVGDFHNGLCFGRKNDKVGFLNKEGKWVVEPQYDKVRDFKNGYAAVRKGDSWGFIDTNGKVVVEAIYDGAKDFELTK